MRVMGDCYLIDSCGHLGFTISVPVSVFFALLWRLVWIKALRRKNRPEDWRLEGFSGFVIAAGSGAAAALVLGPVDPQGAVFAGIGSVPGFMYGVQYFKDRRKGLSEGGVVA